MISVLFVCHGNICRSPISEFVMKDMVTKRGIKAKFYIASAATSTEEIWNGIGNPVYPPAKRELAKHGISCEGKRAVQITKADYGKYDYILGMEERNIRNILRIVGKDPEGKVKLLLDYSDNPRDIADPWYTRDFESTYRDVVVRSAFRARGRIPFRWWLRPPGRTVRGRPAVRRPYRVRRSNGMPKCAARPARGRCRASGAACRTFHFCVKIGRAKITEKK